MTDLISRYTAIDAIRALGADKDHLVRNVVSGCALAVKDVSPVDAIPVEWLKKVVYDADNAGDFEMRNAIASLLCEWKRRNKDGTKENL